MRKDSFERFYYEKVGLGEGCGCAEHVTRIRDLDALGQKLASGRAGPSALAVITGWLREGVALIFLRGTKARR
ncbi:hypothetical protein [Mesorhizobium sp. IMUNJ 23232]|uniref:hypothetical protein n=1 Tax=Mesorhizobium sp. IMUNJ 23232 TaxID=3376064 RepID=UPI0037A89892